MEIKPTYITFEQAKWLREKGFDEECSHSYKEVEPIILYQHQDKKYNNSFKKEWQNTVRKNSQMDNAVINRYSAPEQWQVVEWLRVNHGIWVIVLPELLNGEKIRYYPSIFEKGVGEDIEQYFDTPQEAISAAFDYILKELI